MKKIKNLSYKDKLKHLKTFTDSTMQEITESKEAFKKFLDFQSKFYKYRFEDSLLIYAQDPNANACATYDQWHDKKIGRSIFKNPKTIYVFDGNAQSQLKYLFELGDTHGKPFRFPNKNIIPEKHQMAVLQKLLGENGNPLSDDFSINFKYCIEKYVLENYDDFISEFQETNKNRQNADILSEKDYKDTLIDSIGYVLCQRFSVPKGIYNNEEVAFMALDKFNSKEMIMLLGTVTQDISKKVINQVNQTIIIEEKRAKDERKQEELEHQREQGNDNSRKTGLRGHEGNIRGHQEIDGGNGRTETAENREIRQDVGKIHGAETHGEESVSDNGTSMVGNASGSPRGSGGNDDESAKPVQKTEATSERELHGDTSLRESDEGLGGGNSPQGDSLQAEIEADKTAETDDFQAEIDKVDNLQIGDKMFLAPQMLLFGTRFLQCQPLTFYGAIH